MKILLDHCLDRRIKKDLTEHDYSTCREVGLDQHQNGALLRAAAEQGFDALLTTDQNIKHQQNLEELPIAIVGIDVRDTRLAAIQPLVPSVLNAIEMTREALYVGVLGVDELEVLAKRQKPDQDQDQRRTRRR